MSAVSTLIATDLDQTLIYSRRAIARWGGDGDAVVAVERYEGVDSSFVTATAAASLAQLHDHALVVPTTTRTPEQLDRVRLPGPPVRYAIAANGGILLVDGTPDPDWSRAVASRLAASMPVAEVHAHALASCRQRWTKLVRTASDLFVYAVLDRDLVPDSFVDDETRWAAAHGWRVSLQGRKLYWVPAALTKSAAVAELVRRVGASRVLAAGDSLLDADLLLHADAGIAARHGELVASGWHAPHVEITEHEGICAGAEVAAWLATRVRLSRSRADPA